MVSRAFCDEFHHGMEVRVVYMIKGRTMSQKFPLPPLFHWLFEVWLPQISPFALSVCLDYTYSSDTPLRGSKPCNSCNSCNPSSPRFRFPREPLGLVQKSKVRSLALDFIRKEDSMIMSYLVTIPHVQAYRFLPPRIYCVLDIKPTLRSCSSFFLLTSTIHRYP